MRFTQKNRKHKGGSWGHTLVKGLAVMGDNRASHGPSQWRTQTPGAKYSNIGNWKSAYGRSPLSKYQAPPLPPQLPAEEWEKARVKQTGGKTRKHRKKIKMKESILRIVKSDKKEKKYTAFVRDKKTRKVRKIHFGASDYEQFKDRTKVGYYSHKNHGNRKRQQNYYNRHSGTKKRREAIDKEERKSKGYYNAKILSHRYLW